jgi:predicted DNA-binding ribbon-helix-helix protein
MEGQKRNPPATINRKAMRAGADKGSLTAGRTVKFGGRQTNVRLENAFWDALQEIAANHGVQVGELVAKIDKHRQFKNLSSAIRVFVLKHNLAQRPLNPLSAKQRHKNKRDRPAKRS